MAISIMTISVMTLSVMTLSVMILSKMTVNAYAEFNILVYFDECHDVVRN